MNSSRLRCGVKPAGHLLWRLLSKSDIRDEDGRSYVLADTLLHGGGCGRGHISSKATGWDDG